MKTNLSMNIFVHELYKKIPLFEIKVKKYS